MYVSIITYILCRLPANESRVVTLYGFFRIPMPYLPFILTIASVLFKQEDWINAIITLAIAHVFYFLLVILPSPQYGGSDILSFMKFTFYPCFSFIFISNYILSPAPPKELFRHSLRQVERISNHPVVGHLTGVQDTPLIVNHERS